MPKQIFKNLEQQAIFDKQGFIVLPFLNPEDVSYLDGLFDELHPELPTSGFISGSYSSDFDYKKRASDQIKEKFNPHFQSIFQDYHPIGGAFLFKMPSQESELIIHQDWSIVDENDFFALNIWVPLIDTNERNGPLMVLPGSHYQKFPVLRAPTLPFFFANNENTIKDNLVPLHVKAGHTVILNQSLVHYSPANLSGKIRKAITAGVISQGAELRLLYKDKGSDKAEIEVFQQEEDFLISFEDFFKDIFQKPKTGNSIGKLAYAVPSFSEDELNKLVQKMISDAGYSIQPSTSLLQKLKQMAGFGS